MDVGRLVHEVLRTDVDGDDAHHRDAADVFDGRQAWLPFFHGSCCRGFLLTQKKNSLLLMLLISQ